MQRKLTPHNHDLVIFGDSLCTDFFVSTPAPTMLRARLSANKGGWQKYTQFKTKTYSTVSGHIHPSPPSLRWRSKYLLGAKSLREKIHQYVKEFKKHPRGYFIWIGHNNLDWSEDIKFHSLSVEEYLKQYPIDMVENIFKELFFLIKTTSKPKNITPLIVAGLVNFQDYFELRNQTLVTRNNFKYAHMSEYVFPSISKEHQLNLITLWKNFNSELEKACEKYKEDFIAKNFHLIFSKKFSEIPIKDPRILNPSDCWHLSEFGRKYFADYIEDYLVKTLEASDS